MRSLRPLRLRSASLAVALILIVACGAAAQFGDTHVIRSFTPPGASPFGLDYVEDAGGIGTLYHTDWESGDVYSITTGGAATLLFNVSEQIGQPYWSYTAAAMCYVGSGDNQRAGSLYIIEMDRSGPQYTYVREFTMDGTLVTTYDISAHIDRPWGITYDGTHFWLISNGEFKTFDSEFNVVGSYVKPWGVDNGGLDFDPSTGLLYNAAWGWSYIMVLDRGANYVGHWYLDDNYRFSLAIGHVTRESRTLWVYDQTDYLLKEIADIYYDPVDPTSWGGIKALYR